MAQREVQSEKWLLWTYGVLSAVLLLVCQFVDALVTDVPEPWHQNVSYMLGATICIAGAGILLLKPFKQPYAVAISLGTAVLVWPMIWIGIYIAEMLTSLVMLSGERVAILFLFCIGALIIVLPSALERIIYSVRSKI